MTVCGISKSWLPRLTFQITALGLLVGVVVSLVPVSVFAGTVAPNFSAIATSETFSCGVASGKVYCWGRNEYGQFGNGTYISSNTPVAVSTSGVLSGKTVTAVSVGRWHACALAGGQAYCWGANGEGQLGNNSIVDSNTPVAVSASGVLSGKTVTSISAGYLHTCAIAGGAAYCWGDNNNRTIGDGTSTDSSVPVAVSTSGVFNGKTIASISASETATCGLTSDGIAACWGLGDVGQLGNGSTTATATPIAITTSGALSGKTVTALSTGGAHSCVLASDAKLYCWGYNAWGQLGNNTTTTSNVPTAVTMSGVLSGKTIAILNAGYENTCVKVTTGELYCWGLGTYGEIGNGSTQLRALVPTAVTMSGALAGRTVSSIDVGHGDTSSGAGSICATTTSGRAFCWGRNNYGQVGDGTSGTDINVPTAVVITANLTAQPYRFYQNANAATPGTPLATTNTAPQLAVSGAAFRLRTGIASGADTGDLATLNTFKLQFVQRSAATCSAQTTGFADVTTTSAIAWNTNAGVANGATITTTANDPTASGTTTAQTYQSSVGPFGAPQDTPAGNVAMWDFSLKDNGALASTDYCFRIAYSSGTAMEAAAAYPQIKTAAPVVVGVDIVDAGGAVVPSPSYALTTSTVKTTCQAISGTFATSSQKIRVTNTAATNGWSLSLAPSNGASDLWNRSDNAAKYDFNDPSGSPAGCNSGSDGDGYGGQLGVDPSGAVVAPQAGCANTGITKGASAKYSQGVVDAVTLLSASSSAATNCYWDVTGIALGQQVPASQSSGLYSLNMTLTVVAQ